ncbi:MAG: ACP S-malonyltransferase [Verrucomicrobia bacterium]|nr:ACP S-malonyltransferase [Verrucomicrobiota bacterium]
MKTAFLFPGQGAQFVGMGKELAESIPSARSLFDKAGEVLGYDLSAICFDGPEGELTRSDHAQPGIFVVSVAAYHALKERAPNLDVAAMAGLSSGEWTALHLSGAVSFEDALRILEARGRFMQEACTNTQGGMLSIIGLSAEESEDIARQCGVQAANYNSPAQTVLSGDLAGIAEAETLAQAAGAKRAVRLNVAGAFHSPLMESAAQDFGRFLSDVEIQEPSLPVLSNVKGGPHGSADKIPASMTQQIVSSVQWVKNVQWIVDQGVTHCVECGPGKVLSGLVKRIDKEISLLNIQDLTSLESAVTSLNDG